MSEKDGPIFHGFAHDALQFGHVDLVNVEEVVHELLLGPQFLVVTLLKKSWYDHYHKMSRATEIETQKEIDPLQLHIKSRAWVVVIVILPQCSYNRRSFPRTRPQQHFPGGSLLSACGRI